jgi:hypothetical protein
MPTYRSKSLTSMLEVEKELKALIGSLKTIKSKKTAHKTILSAKNIVGKAMLEMPSSEQYLAPVKKSLVPILNTLGGLADGLQDDSIDLKDFQRTVKNLNDRFIPKFRDEIDRVVKKVGAESKRYNKDGVLHTDESILEELRKVASEVQRIYRTVSSSSADKLNMQQLSTMLQVRGELAATTYEALPSGKDLDLVALTLVSLSDLCYKSAGKVLTRGKIPSDLASGLAEAHKSLTSNIATIHKKVINSILTYDDERKRKPISSKSKEVEKDLPLTRSSEEHLKEKITDIKGKKADLPKRIKSDYEFIRSPVVAIFDSHDDIAKRDRPEGPGTVKQNFSKQRLLDQFGIKYVMLEDYVILQNQVLLAVDREFIEKLARAHMGRRKKAIDNKMLLEYAKQILDMVNSRSSENYVMVSPTFTANPRNTNILLFWVMPSRILSPLIQKGWNKMAEWSLPFDH